MVGTGIDVTDARQVDAERAAAEVRLRHMAEHDALTGLFNRRRFEQELDRHIAYGRRYGMGGALLLLDLDDFKRVNDEFGHRAGDRVLTGVAVVLNHRLRESDIVARFGGDEFAVLMPVGAVAEATELADLLAAAIRADVPTPAGPLYRQRGNRALPRPQHGGRGAVARRRRDVRAEARRRPRGAPPAPGRLAPLRVACAHAPRQVPRARGRGLAAGRRGDRARRPRDGRRRGRHRPGAGRRRVECRRASTAGAVEPEPREVHALNKPAGVVSTARDTHGRPTVVELVPVAPAAVPGRPARRRHHRADPAHERRRARGPAHAPALRGEEGLPGAGRSRRGCRRGRSTH